MVGVRNMKKVGIGVVMVAMLGACDSPAFNAEFEEIRQASAGLINIHTPSNMRQREQRMIMEAVEHQVNRDWSAKLDQCTYGKCYIDVDVVDVRYRSGVPNFVKVRVRSRLLDGSGDSWGRYETYSRSGGRWVLQRKSR